MKHRNAGTLIVAFALMIVIITGTATRTKGVMVNMSLCGEATESFRLSARIEDKQFKVGEPIVLKLRIRNITRQILYLTETNPESDYQVFITNEHGERVPLTELGQRLSKNKEDFRVIGVKIKPGEQRQETIEITRLHSLTIPGPYAITAKRIIKNQNGKGWLEVVSNVVNITVIR